VKELPEVYNLLDVPRIIPLSLIYIYIVGVGLVLYHSVYGFL